MVCNVKSEDKTIISKRDSTFFTVWGIRVIFQSSSNAASLTQCVFAPLATLVDEDAELDSIVTHFNKAVTDTAAELLGKQRRKSLDFCDVIRDFKKKKGEPEGAKGYSDIKRKTLMETGQYLTAHCITLLYEKTWKQQSK